MARNNRSLPLSEGIVRLTRPHQGPGVKVHAPMLDGGFVTLSAAMCIQLDDPDAQANNNPGCEEAIIRVTIGNASDAFVVPVPTRTTPVTLLSNVWVDPGQEVWVSTSVPNRHAVYGFAAAHPVT